MMSDHMGGLTPRPRKWTLFLLLGVMVAGSFIFLKYPLIFRIPPGVLHTAHDAFQSKGQVKCSVAFNVDKGHYLRLKIAIACDGNTQRLDVTRILPRFKHELLMELGRPEMEEVVKNRDFRTLKAHFVGILNRLVKRPIKKVYIENFFID